MDSPALGSCPRLCGCACLPCSRSDDSISTAAGARRAIGTSYQLGAVLENFRFDPTSDQRLGNIVDPGNATTTGQAARGYLLEPRVLVSNHFKNALLSHSTTPISSS